jgi:putative endonuclease
VSRALGAIAEARAADLLQRQGYRVADRNWTCKGGEIDLVCVAPDGTLVFVEVRARANARHGSALETILDGKRRRLLRAAAIYLHVKGKHDAACRFDVVAITGDAVEHVEDAFRATW